MLVPLLPFAVLLVAGLLARGGRFTSWTAVVLAAAGGLLMLLFVGVGGRVPQFFNDPLVEVVWPLWVGETVRGWTGEPFARNVCVWLAPEYVAGLAPELRGLQFAPLVLGQAVAFLAMLRVMGTAGKASVPAQAGSNLCVDEQKDRRCEGEDAEDPAA